jgi:hypothetical protein
MSAVEVCTTTTVSGILAALANYYLLPTVWTLPPTPVGSVTMAVFFAMLGMATKYPIRRVFNFISTRGEWMSAIDKILETEFSSRFVELMKNAMTVSFYKYGKVAEAYPHKVDAMGSLTERLRKYAATGNTEYLVDVANFAMIEFMFPRHPEAFFKGTDDDGSPGRRVVKTGLLDKRDNQTIGTNPNSKLTAFR